MQSKAVKLPCSVQNFRMICQLILDLQGLSLRWIADSFTDCFLSLGWTRYLITLVTVVLIRVPCRYWRVWPLPFNDGCHKSRILSCLDVLTPSDMLSRIGFQYVLSIFNQFQRLFLFCHSFLSFNFQWSINFGVWSVAFQNGFLVL